MPPRWLRCSLKYSRYSRSSRLAIEAPRPSRCDAGLSPRAANARARRNASWTTFHCSSTLRRPRPSSGRNTGLRCFQLSVTGLQAPLSCSRTASEYLCRPIRLSSRTIPAVMREWVLAGCGLSDWKRNASCSYAFANCSRRVSCRRLAVTRCGSIRSGWPPSRQRAALSGPQDRRSAEQPCLSLRCFTGRSTIRRAASWRSSAAP
jgi:hypothetical protein